MNRNAVLGGLYIALAAVIFSTMEVLLKLPAVAGAFHPLQITVDQWFVQWRDTYKAPSGLMIPNDQETFCNLC